MAADGELTLAFALEAYEALADPRAAFADARRWSQYVGVVAEDADAVERAVRRHGVTQDYEIGDRDRQAVLSRLKWEADTPRYVFVGSSSRDRDLADHVGWEYVPIDEAAAAADWRLQADLSRLERFRVRLSSLLP